MQLYASGLSQGFTISLLGVLVVKYCTYPASSGSFGKPAYGILWNKAM